MKDWIIRTVFSKLIPFKWIDGHKTEIARYSAFFFALLALVQKFFPTVPYLDQVDAYMGMVLSLVGVEVGKAHREFKNG